MELVVLPLPRLNFKTGQQRCQFRGMSIFPPTLKESVFQLGFPFARLARGMILKLFFLQRGTVVRPQPRLL